MRVMLLTAGLGTRVRPHTYSKPKPLVSVAGKPVLAHIIDDLLDIRIDELIVVTGYMGDQIERFVSEMYGERFPTRFLVQAEMRGQADAINLANEVSGPLLVVFGDGLFSVDKQRLNSHPDYGIIYCKEVEDPRRFGVAVVEDGWITRLVEKPAQPVSNLAVIGAYYLPAAERLMGAIHHIMEHNIQTKGEYYLADALQVMIERGERLAAEPVEMWRDCGTIDALLDTNRYLLDHGHARGEAGGQALIIPPVHIGPNVTIERSVLGPHVSISEGAVIRDAVISDSIVNAGAEISGIVLRQSVIGDKASVAGAAHTLNIGDTSSISVR